MGMPKTVSDGLTVYTATMVATDGTAITTGTVGCYVLALTGENTGKWYRNSDSTWRSDETSNNMTHQSKAEWSITFSNSPFEDGIVYDVYAQESGNLNIPYGESILAKHIVEEGDYLLTCTIKDQDGNLVGGAAVSLYPSGNNVLQQKLLSNTLTGVSVFNVESGSYDIRVNKNGWGTWQNPYYYHIVENTSIDITGTRFVVENDVVPNISKLYAFVSDLGLDPKENVELIVKASGSSIYNNANILIPVPVESLSDADGYVEADVPSGVAVKIVIPKANYERYYLPTASLINLAEL